MNISNTKLTITNTLGQVVFTTRELQAKQEIDVSFLDSGVYFVTLRQAQGMRKQKTIKVIKE